jgi:hypothetical protein
MANKWDLRFGGDDFFYGKAPNVFFADFLSTLPEKGKLGMLRTPKQSDMITNKN